MRRGCASILLILLILLSTISIFAQSQICPTQSQIEEIKKFKSALSESTTGKTNYPYLGISLDLQSVNDLMALKSTQDRIKYIESNYDGAKVVFLGANSFPTDTKILDYYAKTITPSIRSLVGSGPGRFILPGDLPDSPYNNKPVIVLYDSGEFSTNILFAHEFLHLLHWQQEKNGTSEKPKKIETNNKGSSSGLMIIGSPEDFKKMSIEELEQYIEFQISFLDPTKDDHLDIYQILHEHGAEWGFSENDLKLNFDLHQRLVVNLKGAVQPNTYLNSAMEQLKKKAPNSEILTNNLAIFTQIRSWAKSAEEWENSNKVNVSEQEQK